MEEPELEEVCAGPADSDMALCSQVTVMTRPRLIILSLLLLFNVKHYAIIYNYVVI